MFFLKIGVFLYLKLSLYEFVFSHESRNHEHYSFKELQDAVNGDSLKSDDLQRLFDKLHFLNCSANKSSPDYRRVSVVGENSPKDENFTLKLGSLKLNLVR